MKRNKTFFFLVLFCLMSAYLLTILAQAHSGRTDSKGGHYDRSTGIYHYHHGMEAHDHPNGVCPYGYGNTTPQNSKRSTSKTSTSKVTTRKTTTSRVTTSRVATSKTSTSKISNNGSSNHTTTYIILTALVLVFGIACFIKEKK